MIKKQKNYQSTIVFGTSALYEMKQRKHVKC